MSDDAGALLQRCEVYGCEASYPFSRHRPPDGWVRAGEAEYCPRHAFLKGRLPDPDPPPSTRGRPRQVRVSPKAEAQRRRRHAEERERELAAARQETPDRAKRAVVANIHTALLKSAARGGEPAVEILARETPDTDPPVPRSVWLAYWVSEWIEAQHAPDQPGYDERPETADERRARLLEKLSAEPNSTNDL